MANLSKLFHVFYVSDLGSSEIFKSDWPPMGYPEGMGWNDNAVMEHAEKGKGSRTLFMTSCSLLNIYPLETGCCILEKCLPFTIKNSTGLLVEIPSGLLALPKKGTLDISTGLDSLQLSPYLIGNPCSHHSSENQHWDMLENCCCWHLS